MRSMGGISAVIAGMLSTKVTRKEKVFEQIASGSGAL
jgi:hypothetical protein